MAIVKLNIGGVRFTTTNGTLLQNEERNFFHGLLSGELSVERDDEGALFIDREGKYFAPILEYMRTGELVIPPDINTAFVLRESEFYGIKLPPIAETLETKSLSFITDSWIKSRSRHRYYDANRAMVDELLGLILEDIHTCVENDGNPICSKYLLPPRKCANVPCNHEYVDAAYKENHALSAHTYALLHSSREKLTEILSQNDLTVKIAPISFLWKKRHLTENVINSNSIIFAQQIDFRESSSVVLFTAYQVFWMPT
jgi:hypothetical protein